MKFNSSASLLDKIFAAHRYDPDIYSVDLSPNDYHECLRSVTCAYYDHGCFKDFCHAADDSTSFEAGGMTFNLVEGEQDEV